MEYRIWKYRNLLSFSHTKPPSPLYLRTCSQRICKIEQLFSFLSPSQNFFFRKTSESVGHVTTSFQFRFLLFCNLTAGLSHSVSVEKFRFFHQSIWRPPILRRSKTVLLASFCVPKTFFYFKTISNHFLLLIFHARFQVKCSLSSIQAH